MRGARRPQWVARPPVLAHARMHAHSTRARVHAQAQARARSPARSPATHARARARTTAWLHGCMAARLHACL
eukprot:3056504-Lingulodinium_polyedra.AAC.1